MSALRIAVGPLVTLDPATCFDHDGVMILRLLADPLVGVAPGNGELLPAAAEDWDITPDGLRLTFALRRAVRFHHGREVTADDYAYSWSRLVRPETGSQLASLLSVVDGYEEVRAGRALRLRGVREVGAHRLEVWLNRPFHEAAAVFTHSATVAVPAELTGAGFDRAPVGTGPYRMARPWEPRGSGPVVLERFAGYHGRNGAFPRGGTGSVARIEFGTVAGPEAARRGWLDGLYDLVQLSPRLARAMAADPGYHRVTSAALTYLGLPITVPPFNDRAVRKAIAMGIDRSRFGPPANRIVPPVLGGDQTGFMDVAYSPEEARATLSGVTVPIAYDVGNLAGDWVGEVVADLRANVGCDAVARPMSREDYLSWMAEPDAAFRATWICDYPSPDGFLYPLFHSEGSSGAFGSGSVDALIDAARATPDSDHRAELYRAAERAVCADLPVVPLWFGLDHYLMNTAGFWADPPLFDATGAPSLRLLHSRSDLMRSDMTDARPDTKKNGLNMESASRPPASQTAPTLLLVGGARPVVVSIDMVRDALGQAAARGIAGHVVAPAAALAATVPVIEAADAVSAVEIADPAVIRAWVAQQAKRGRRFDMVYALQEMAQVAAAEAARALGVAGNPPEAVRRIRTKDLCRAALAQAGFAQPNVRLCASAADASAFAAEFPGPWVVKPRDAMGSLGVSLVEDLARLPEALAQLPEPDRFLVEQFVAGPEFSVEGVFLDGQPCVFAVTAKDKTDPPFFVEVGHTLPAGLSAADEARVRHTVESALLTLGLRVGAFHVELWLTETAVVLGEVHGRHGGDWIHRMLEYSFPGLELYGVIYDDLLGRSAGPRQFVPERGAAVRYLTPPPGRVVSVEGWAEAAAHPAVIYSELAVHPGDRISPLRKSSDRVGVVVVGAQDSAAAEKLARKLVASVRFTVKPDDL